MIKNEKLECSKIFDINWSLQGLQCQMAPTFNRRLTAREISFLSQLAHATRREHVLESFPSKRDFVSFDLYQNRRIRGNVSSLTEIISQSASMCSNSERRGWQF